MFRQQSQYDSRLRFSSGVLVRVRLTMILTLTPTLTIKPTLTLTITLTLTRSPDHNPNHNHITNSNPNPNITITLTLTKTLELNLNRLSYWDCCRRPGHHPALVCLIIVCICEILARKVTNNNIRTCHYIQIAFVICRPACHDSSLYLFVLVLFLEALVVSQVGLHVALDIFYQRIVHVYRGVVYNRHLCFCDVHLKTCTNR